jgi:pimeloyl-ACP methyl ester carboxylesterase
VLLIMGVGASMGGAISQTMAIEHPGRVRSLTSMMSTTGNMSVGQPSPEVLRAVFSGPPATTREEVIQQRLRAFRAVGSPKFPNDEKEVASQAGRAYDRSHDPMGVADRVCDVSGGQATAEAIPGAELMLIEGMGHDLPPCLRSQLAQRIAEFVWRADGR